VNIDREQNVKKGKRKKEMTETTDKGNRQFKRRYRKGERDRQKE
jgi:hypothetical protein